MMVGMDMNTELYGVHVQDESAAQPPTRPMLIGYRALFKDSWKVLQQTAGQMLSTIIFVTVMAALLLFAVGSFILAAPAYVRIADGSYLMAIIYLGANLVYMVAWLAYQRSVMCRAAKSTFGTEFRYVLGNFLGLFVVGFYAQTLISVGYMLFILPGIAVAVYLQFSHLVVLQGEYKNMLAIVRSIELVYGRWWSVMGRVLYPILFFGGYLLTAFVLVWFFPPLIILFLISVPVLIFWSTTYLIVLYESLTASVAPHIFSTEQTQSLLRWLRLLVWIGAILLVIITVTSVYGDLTHPAVMSD